MEQWNWVYVSMVMTPKSVSSSVPASTPSVRPSAARAQTSGGGGAVEETSAQVNVSFDTAMLFQNNHEAGGKQDDASKGKTLVEYSGSNQTFANILEDSVLTSTEREAGRTARRGFSGYLSRAINIYETNARVIHGLGAAPRGSTISLTL